MDSDFEAWRGYRPLCRQTAWTVSRGRLRGLVPGRVRRLLDEDETERTIAALFIADAADHAGAGEPAFFGGGHGPLTPAPAGAPEAATLPNWRSTTTSRR